MAQNKKVGYFHLIKMGVITEILAKHYKDRKIVDIETIKADLGKTRLIGATELYRALRLVQEDGKSSASFRVIVRKYLAVYSLMQLGMKLDENAEDVKDYVDKIAEALKID